MCRYNFFLFVETNKKKLIFKKKFFINKDRNKWKL